MVTSATGVLALLDEDEPALQVHALQALNGVVDQFWAEISDYVAKIETLYEDTKFPESSRQLAALVASKVYYHLGAFDEALNFALGAGPLFDVSGGGEYVDTVISRAIDTYIALRSGEAEVDPRLGKIVEQMFARCIDDGEFKQAAGIALDARRYDVIQHVFELTKDAGLLRYVLEAATDVVDKIEERNKVLRLLSSLFASPALPTPDYFSITQCHVQLNDPALASSLLIELVRQAAASPGSIAAAAAPLAALKEKLGDVSGRQDPALVAYQIAFDLVDTATQEFLGKVAEGLPKEGAAEGEAIQTDEKKEDGADAIFDRIRDILTGEVSIRLNLEFLHRNNKADPLILKNTKEALEARSSMYHSAVTFANAFMHAGTTSDAWLRDNLEWLGKANNWSKFTATAALGVIHKGNLPQGLTLLGPYLPRGAANSSQYSEGGSLYALGLIHANHGGDVLDFLKDQLKTPGTTEIVQHGAALGLGIAGIATGNEEIYDELRNVLFTDSAIAGEAAGYAMGLVMLGTGSDKALDEMLQYAHETQHEKIIRGLAVGIAFLMYAKEEGADKVIASLLKETDPILRYGGIHTIALAYAGTGNNKAIRQLLHVAVSDVNDDVRRASVTALGFILFRNPSQVPRIVQLLSESYNPHVRYGAAIALGIACAGTALEEAVELLEPMTKDPVDFVRQGAFVSLALILIQANETAQPKVASVREKYVKVLSDKHEDPMAKFGAALAQGLIDAGGRNVTVSLQSKSGSTNLSAVVGMALFTQFWYWFPLAHAVSLAFTPTALIGLNKDLKIPQLEFISNAKPSQFAYVPPLKPPTKETVEKVATAVLSTTARANARTKQKEKEKAAAEGMETDDKPEEKKAEKAAEDEAMQTDEKDGAAKEGADADKAGFKKRAPEPSSERLPNLSRVTPAQVSYISFPADSRYVPVRALVQSSATSGAPASGVATPSTRSTGHKRRPTLSSVFSSTPRVGGGGGILMLVDRRPGEPEEFIELKAGIHATPAPAGGAAAAAAEPEEPELGPPEPFEYPFDRPSS